MKEIKTLVAILLVYSFGKASAQTGDLGQLELSVTDKYKARVGEANKYSELPNFEDTINNKIAVDYSIKSEAAPVKSNPKPLKPARIAKVAVDKLNSGMLKLGFGFYGTSMVEGYYSSGRSSKYSYGFWGKHFATQRGASTTIFDDNSLSNNELGAYFDRFYKKLRWETKASVKFDKYSYYGVDRLTGIPVQDLQWSAEPDENWYRQFAINSAFIGKKKGSLGSFNQGSIDYYNFSDNYEGVENYLKLNSDWSLPTLDQDLELDLNLTYFRTDFDSIIQNGQSYFTLQGRPHISATMDKVIFDFGLNLYSNTNYNQALSSSSTALYFFPEIKVQYPFVEGVLSAYFNLNGRLEHNTFRNLTLDNPYVDPGFDFKPTRTTNFILGMEGILSANTSFHVKGGLKVVRDMVFYVQNPFFYLNDSTSRQSLEPIFDNTNIFFARGELSSKLREDLALNLFGELRSFNNNNLSKAFHRPNFESGLTSTYYWKKKIKLKAKLSYIGAREAFDQNDNLLIESTLNGYLNMDLGLEYIYNSRLSAFINAYNLFNNPYDLYLGFRAQRTNVIFGISYQF